MSVYYNEHDPFAATWLKELIKAGEIPDGEVDTRDIQLVTADDVRGFTQCHWFAGIGGWALAARLAGWGDRPIWTGSCPCQPFSAAGKQKGGGDDRHLWPHWARLIRECKPATIVGEQVESAIAHGWLDAVFDDLESEGYAVGAVDLPAASVGAPHRRQRIWFVAHAYGRDTEHRGIQRGREHGLLRDAGDAERAEGRMADRTGNGWREERQDGGRIGAGDGAEGQSAGSESGGESGLMADHDRAGRDWIETPRLHGRRTPTSGREAAEGVADGTLWNDADGCSESGELAHSGCERTGRGLRGPGEGAGAADLGASDQPERSGIADSSVADAEHAIGRTVSVDREDVRDGADARRAEAHGESGACGEVRNPWADCTWLPCRDGKWRPVESEPEPVFDGLSESLGLVRHGDTHFYSPLVQKAKNRVGRLRGYGNAIVPHVAAEVLRALLEITEDY